MTRQQRKMLGEAKLEWLDAQLVEHEVATWVVQALRTEPIGSMKLFGAMAWLHANGFAVAEMDNQVLLVKDGRVLSRFVWTVE